jgi:hypothetical protein
MLLELDHIGILVDNLVDVLITLRHFDWPIGEIKEFPTEGTREVYVGLSSSSGRLLFLEPVGDGPYKDAMEKRGPGVHHIGIHVEDMMVFIERISGSGWYLHPKSLPMWKTFKTVWLARPGVPLLLEVIQRKSLSVSERVEFVTRIEVPFPESRPFLAAAIGIDQLQPSTEGRVFITIDSKRLSLDDLLRLDSQ